MTPANIVINGVDITNARFGDKQPQYLPLPAYRTPDGIVSTRWRLSWLERLKVFFSGEVWLSQLTFNHPYQPVKLEAVCPLRLGEDEQA